jgi:endonuclease G
MKRLFLFLLILFPGPGLMAQHPATRADGKKVLLFDDHTWVFAENEKTAGITRGGTFHTDGPSRKPGDELVVHTGYSLVYAEGYEQAAWVAYELSPSRLSRAAGRTDRFIPDPAIKTGSATASDYARSGYDRGHLAPAADMAWSEKAMAESFYFSNMSPQVPGFNRGIWKQAEEQVRRWASETEKLFVVTGPVLRPGLPVIGPNRVAVPELYYKVVLDHSGGHPRMLAFLMPNRASGQELQSFVVPVDSVEKLTGLDLYAELPDEVERKVESEVCLPCWNWESRKKPRTTRRGK